MVKMLSIISWNNHFDQMTVVTNYDYTYTVKKMTL